MAKLIVALDYAEEREALNFISQLDPRQCAVKVGLEMFSFFGPDFVSRLIAQQFKVFLDLKFHDIPNTVSRACKACADLGVWMLNVHASGGRAMMDAARNALEPYGKDKPNLIAVTVLTSMSQAQLEETGVHHDLTKQVTSLAGLALSSALDGVVCSALETKFIKESCGSSFIAVTPGIRLPDSQPDDQSRIVTPAEAVQLGSDYLVVGRPITRAVNPGAVIKQLYTANLISGFAE